MRRTCRCARPTTWHEQWSVDPASGLARGDAPSVSADGDGASVSGELAFVPDAPGADLLVGVALRDGKPVGVAIEADAKGVSVEAVHRYDATRSLGHVTLKDAPALILDAPVEALAGAWHLAQALIAAESIGSVETALEVSVAYAKERHTFGRAIGSYQAVKHSLTEVLRQLDNGRSLLYYAGWARNGAPAEFPLAASAARSVGGRALDTGRAHDDLGARRHRRDLGARRAAVLPPRAAVAAAARRHGRRDRPRRRRADRAGRRGLAPQIAGLRRAGRAAGARPWRAASRPGAAPAGCSAASTGAP